MKPANRQKVAATVTCWWRQHRTGLPVVVVGGGGGDGWWVVVLGRPCSHKMG